MAWLDQSNDFILSLLTPSLDNSLPESWAASRTSFDSPGGINTTDVEN